MPFPDDFAWGVTVPAFQVEGAAAEDGKGPSVWDMFARKPGAIRGGADFSVACDSYHRYREDVALMGELGLRAVNMSISWPRVLPDGVGQPNEAGLDFYDRLVDALLAAGVEPWVMLFHWDFPLALYRRGGWLNRDSAEWLAEYTTLLVERLSDRVTRWMTLTEPDVFIGEGPGGGTLAPGDRLSFAEVLHAAHNTLLAHGKAVQAIRASAKQPASVGLSPSGPVRAPHTDSADDLEAARRAMFSIVRKDVNNNTWWLDPIFRGAYPQDGLELFGPDVPEIRDGDMEIISQPLDFFGASIYSGHTVRAAEEAWYRVPDPPGAPKNLLDWRLLPETLYYGPKLFHERYGKPIVITENGLCSHDWVALDGGVHDPLRIDFMQRHLLQLERATADGVPVEGYFHFAFIDNVECAEGYKPRFGIVHCDFETLARTVKDSGRWYAEVIGTNGAALSSSSSYPSTPRLRR
jgi:beta-glucosidase